MKIHYLRSRGSGFPKPLLTLPHVLAFQGLFPVERGQLRHTLPSPMLVPIYQAMHLHFLLGFAKGTSGAQRPANRLVAQPAAYDSETNSRRMFYPMLRVWGQ